SVNWNRPLLPFVLHMSMVLSDPTPMSEVTTAMCTLGRRATPFSSGICDSTLMNCGKLRVRLACDVSIEDELSTMKRMSMLRFAVTWKLAWKVCVGLIAGFSSERDVHAHSAGAAAA